MTIAPYLSTHKQGVTKLEYGLRRIYHPGDVVPTQLVVRTGTTVTGAGKLGLVVRTEPPGLSRSG